MYYKSLHEKKHNKWRMLSDMLIHKAIFYDDRDEIEIDILTSVTAAAEKLAGNRHFRKFIVNEIMSAKKNISGMSSGMLKQLYQQLGLEIYASIKLKSRKWYVKAKAIQELTVMEISEYADQLKQFTNDPNDLVRMEAQSALVQFNGFEGLSFLTTITHPVSQWQQIKLLQLLSLQPPSEMDMVDWFKSANSTVVVFALKLARTYNRFELYYAIVSCLDHPDPQVRLEAIRCLGEIYTHETSDQIILRFLGETFKHQLAMIRVMKKIGTKRDTLFLLDVLNSESDEMKICAARAIVHASNDGLISLEEYSKKSNSSFNEIVMHIKEEIAA